VDAFQEADALIGGGGDRAHWFLLAVAYWQLGKQEQAREAYAQGLNWLGEKKRREESYRFRDEAKQLLGITNTPASPNSGEPQPENPKPQGEASQ
jgi:hypothetical protein